MSDPSRPAGRPRAAHLIAALAIAVVGTSGAQGAAQRARAGLTAGPALARAYDAILDARFDDADALLSAACLPRGASPGTSDDAPALAPSEACAVLELAALWWRIQLDPKSTAHDAEYRTRADAVVDAVEAWTEREPRRAEAWFYLGGALGARVQFRALRGETLAAARDGRRIQDSLEEALRLDPELEDAYFGIGLYHYYADVAPAMAKLLRRLLFLPGGDRDEGLRELQRARAGGQIVRGEADYQLHLLYLWYEHQPERALDIVRTLQARHPRNPHFPQTIAEIEDVYLHDANASLRTWTSLLDAARAQRVEEPRLAEARARLGAALQLDRLHETDLAVEHLRAVVRLAPISPAGATVHAQLQLAEALDRLGHRADAVTAYKAVLGTTIAAEDPAVAVRARDGLRRTPDADATRAYRLSIEGWRALERGAAADAARLLRQSTALAPSDLVAQYRLARALVALREPDDALDVLERIVAAGETDPPSFYAAACVAAARIVEARGDAARAIDLLRLAVDAFGVDRRVKADAERALARLGAANTASPARAAPGTAREPL